MNKGARNLVILGIAATLIALITTSVSLAIYHYSGDIYLDRSRPGFLPDKDEAEGGDDKDDDYDFVKTGEVDESVLDEYLEKIETEVKAIDSFKDPFGESALSDERLGITPDTTE